ncbi:hypothetical protein RvY_03956 [Ramazzottius varieornatus]|uniref:Glutamyl-tRNA(Gln) amidotransferase subunit A, mitochondrial n=1 Tax=Ramazzottius varieornatus TaxID=947166 RepID=A0A1D1UTB9_RAMVA|nr:hypothetical protein RvY_03956 [Ramazzottius varieornatus]
MATTVRTAFVRNAPNTRLPLTSIAQFLSHINQERLSALNLIEAYHQHVQHAQAESNAYTSDLTVNIDAPQVQAMLDGLSQPRLMAVPFAVKDNFCVQENITSCASLMLQDFVPAYTATVVQRLLNAGALLVGKTNMDEFAMGSGSIDSWRGAVTNPWDTTRIAGGSSGGSAAAVASRSAIFALGSDTGGSVRNPASYCGLVGYKPSYGHVSRHGLIPLVNSTDVPAIFTHVVEDARTVYDVIAGPDAKDSTCLTTPPPPQRDSKLNKVKVGIPQELNVPEYQPYLGFWRSVAERLEEHGAEVVPVSLPHSEYANACYTVLCACDVASNMARYDGVEFGHRSTASDVSTNAMYAATRHEGFNEVVRGRILAGNFFLLKRSQQEYFLYAAKVRRLIVQDFTKVFDKEVDVLCMPVTFGVAPTLEEFKKLDNRTQQELQDLFTVAASLAGLPAISVPIAMEGHLPVGIQLVAPNRQDNFLLDVAQHVESLYKFHEKFSLGL